MDLVRKTLADPGAKISVQQLMAQMDDGPGPVRLQSDAQDQEAIDDPTAADLKQFDDVLAFITEKPATVQPQLKLSPDAAVTRRVQENQSIGPLPVFKSLDFSDTQPGAESQRNAKIPPKFVKRLLRQNFKQKLQIRQLSADTQKLYALVNQLASQNATAQQNQRQYQENLRVQLVARFGSIEQQQAKLASTVKANLIKVSAKINNAAPEARDYEKVLAQIDQVKSLISAQG